MASGESSVSAPSTARVEDGLAATPDGEVKTGKGQVLASVERVASAPYFSFRTVPHNIWNGGKFSCRCLVKSKKDTLAAHQPNPQFERTVYS